MIDQEKLDALRQKHGAIYVATINGNDFAFAPPAAWAKAYREFKNAVAVNRVRTYDEGEKLAKAATIFPEEQGFVELLEEFPGLQIDLIDELDDLAKGKPNLSSKYGADPRAAKPVPTSVLEELKAKHPIYTATINNQSFVFKAPKLWAMNFRAYMMALTEDAERGFDESKKFAEAGVAYPDGPALKELFTEFPGMHYSVSDELAQIGRGSARSTAKKG